MTTYLAKERKAKRLTKSRPQEVLPTPHDSEVAALREALELQSLHVKKIADLLVVYTAKAPSRSSTQAYKKALVAYMKLNKLTKRKFSVLVSEFVIKGKKGAKPKAFRYSKAVIKVLKKAEESNKEASEQVEESLPAPPAVDNRALAEARERGSIYRNEVISQTMSGEELALQWRVSRQAVNNRRQAGKLLALSWGANRHRYPPWQVEPAVYAAIPEILRLLHREDPWTVYSFLTTPNAILGDAVPLDLLRESKAQEVIAAAKLFADRD